MDFHLPELGEGVYEAEFVSWLVKPALDDIFVKRDLFMLKVLPLVLLGTYIVIRSGWPHDDDLRFGEEQCVGAVAFLTQLVDLDPPPRKPRGRALARAQQRNRSRHREQDDGPFDDLLPEGRNSEQVAAV